MKYLIFYPDSHKHIGLLEDLKDNPDVSMYEIAFKKIKNKFVRLIRRIHTNWHINKKIKLPARTIWYEVPEIKIERDEEYCIIVFDGAMRGLESEMLNKICTLGNVRIVLVLLNSLNASSFTILELKEKMKEVHWNAVYTFDPDDAHRYSIEYLGCCYYSRHDLKNICPDSHEEMNSDAYFVGGIKGEREDLILSVFKKLHDNGINTNFNVFVSGTRKFRYDQYSDKIKYFRNGWISYSKVLAGIDKTNVIVEVLQKGQTGPSIRYFEAVCYNKKLLTNNMNINTLPYYNEKYMKTFQSDKEIDLEWIKEKVHIDYNYKGDFSPIYLLKRVLE